MSINFVTMTQLKTFNKIAIKVNLQEYLRFPSRKFSNLYFYLSVKFLDNKLMKI